MKDGPNDECADDPIAGVSDHSSPGIEDRGFPTLAIFGALAITIGYLDRVNISVAILAMESEMGLSPVTKGLVLSAFGIGYLICQLPGGWAAQRWGGERVLAFVVLGSSLLTLLTPSVATISVLALVLVRALLGLVEGAMYPSIYAMLGRRVAKERRARQIALIYAGMPVGTLVGLGVSGWATERYGWQGLFYIFGLTGLVWSAAWFFYSRRSAILQAGRDAKLTNRGATPWRLLLASPAVKALIFNQFCSNWTLYLILAWLPSYLRDIQGVDLSSAGLLAAAPWLVMLVAVNVLGAAADKAVRRGQDLTRVRKVMQVTCLAGSAAFLLAMPYATSAGLAVAFICGAMFFHSFAVGGYTSNHLDLSPSHAGALMGAANTAGQLPAFVCIASTGWLVQVTHSYNSAFILAACISLVGAVIWIRYASAKPITD